VIEPPDYPLSRITAPLVFFWSDNDNMATPMDVNLTAFALRPEVLKENVRVGWYLWSHRDFVKGIDADKLVYAHTLRIIKEKRYG
jgi:lysosomal acid lipase/cholesteryl ester hydrolase